MYTLDQLLAAGLSESEARDIISAQQPASGGGKLFAPQVKINYDEDFDKKGLFIFGGAKNKEGAYSENPTVIGDTLEFVLVTTKGQYSMFDQVTNKSTITSNLFNGVDSKSAYDLKSGKLITALKASGYEKIGYATVAAVLMYVDGVLTPASYYIKGTSLNEFINTTKGLDSNGAIKYKFTATNTKEKKGQTVYFTTHYTVTPLTDLEVLKNMKQVAAISKAFNDFVKQINSSGTAPSASGKAPAAPVDDSVDLDDWN